MTIFPGPASLVTTAEAEMRRSTEMTAATPGNQPISILKQSRNLSIFITVHWTTVDGGFNAIKLILTGLFEGPKC